MLPDVWKRFLQQERLRRDDLNLTRKLRSLRHLGSTKVQIGSHEFLNFSSNDYLGLTGDLRIAEAAASAAGRFGWGAAASRLVTGSSTIHSKLESEVARFRGTETALLFGSGYQANLGVLTALLGEGDTVISDAMNHASIIAGCRLSGAKIKVFEHRNYDDLERKLNSVKDGRILVVTDSLFSIEGDTADVARAAKLCERFKALLFVDDAHANACLGKSGKGIAEIQNCSKDVPVVVGTFSKALGSYGGFVACDEETRDFLVNHSRPFIYTTAMPIALAAANIEALKIVRNDGDALRQKLATNTGFLRGKLESVEFETTGDYHIVGVKVGSSDEAMYISSEVEFRGILVQPMRWPTVPEGHECLRVSVTAAHTEEDLARLVDALRKARDSVVEKKTDGLTRREAKRPTHQQLETTVSPSPDLDEIDEMDDHPQSGPMSAIDSQRLPSAENVQDFDPEPAGPGDTILMEPGQDEDGKKTAPVNKLEGKNEDDKPIKPMPKPDEDDEDDKEAEPEEEEAEKDEENDETREDSDQEEESREEEKSENEGEETEDEEGEEEQEGDDDEDDAAVLKEGSGETLAPEPMELEDPVIAEIEGGTKKRKKKKKKKDKTKAKKKS